MTCALALATEGPMAGIDDPLDVIGSVSAGSSDGWTPDNAACGWSMADGPFVGTAPNDEARGEESEG